MEFYIMIGLLPCLIFTLIMLYRFIKHLKRPRYVKDVSFMSMSNGGTLLETAQNKSIAVTYKYINGSNFFYSDGE